MEQVIAPITQFMTAAAVAPHISITSDKVQNTGYSLFIQRRDCKE